MIRKAQFALCLVFAIALAAVGSSSQARAQDAKHQPASAAVPAAPMVNSIKIIFDGKARDSGVLTFAFTPEGGAAKTISVTIAAKMNHKDAARDAAKELGLVLGAGYKVDPYHAHKLRITGKDKTKFSLTISALTAHGLGVRLL